MKTQEDKIRKLRLQLRGVKKWSSDVIALFGEIEKLGHAAAPLIPEILAALDRGLYPTASVLVPIIVQHKNQLLLDALKRHSDSANIGVWEKVALFRAGFIEFQGELLDHLRDAFDRDHEPSRSAIVEAFAESGTASLVQDLEDIESWTSRRLSELEKDEPTLREDERFLRLVMADSQRQFLEKLRHAIERARGRPDLSPTPPEELLPASNVDEDAGGREKVANPTPKAEVISDTELLALNIHPEVARHAQPLLASGHHFHAVFEAAKAYDKTVAVLARSSKHGTDLMFEALSGKKGLVKVTPCKTETDGNVQEGTMHLSVGLMRVVRNPTAHEPALDWPMSKQDALDLLALISFLFRQLDKAKAAKF